MLITVLHHLELLGGLAELEHIEILRFVRNHVRSDLEPVLSNYAELDHNFFNIHEL